jgi:DNA polymerase-4
MRSVLFKMLAKAAMRLRRDGFLAAGLQVRVRFVGTEQRFERDLRFAPIDDTQTLLRLLGLETESLARAAASGRWNARRHPPLSVAVTLVDIEPHGNVTEELMRPRTRTRRISKALDQVNEKFGNNALYFGAMQQAVGLDAAPMRIPFQTIPDRSLEEDGVTRKRRTGIRRPADELWLQRERQFRVLAEASHREAQQRRAAKRGEESPRAGAGGWLPAAPRSSAADCGQLVLF